MGKSESKVVVRCGRSRKYSVGTVVVRKRYLSGEPVQASMTRAESQAITNAKSSGFLSKASTDNETAMANAYKQRPSNQIRPCCQHSLETLNNPSASYRGT